MHTHMHEYNHTAIMRMYITIASTPTHAYDIDVTFHVHVLGCVFFTNACIYDMHTHTHTIYMYISHTHTQMYRT
jgi:hypothetical protein